MDPLEQNTVVIELAMELDAQRLQSHLIKEYALNYNSNPNRI